jgi:CRP-like cAMP-binding protein
MALDSLLSHVRKHVALTEADELVLASLVEAKTIKRKQYVLHDQEVCTKSWFVVSGCLRSYSIDDNGFEHILQFAPAQWWITDMYSLLSGKAGQLNIDAIMDTEVLELTREKQGQLYELVPKFERYFRILTENSLVSSRTRVLDNLELSAKQRYGKFCSVYPELINTLPQKFIAAYIGVKPEFFSKMKAEYMKEH